MKKVTSLLCALVLAISAFALPVVKKAPQLKPIQKAVMDENGGPDAYYQFTTPTDFVALQYGGGTGDYVIWLYANNQPVAQLSIKTASDNSIAGTYILGTYGGQSYNSALYQGNNTLTVEYGVVSLKYKGQLPTTTEDIYEIVASQLLVVNGEQIISYSFSGTVVGLAAWKDYYVECNQTGNNCDKARITLNDGTNNSTFAEISVINPKVDRTSISTDGYWGIMGAGYDSKSNGVAYNAEVYVLADGSNFEGAYSSSDIVKFIDDNEQEMYGAFLSKSTDDGKNWSEIDVKSATVTVSKIQGNMYEYDIYVTDNSNKVYHFVMTENVNTSNALVWYDSSNDFYAAFTVDQVTPFTEQDITGMENGMNYTYVEAYDSYTGNYAVLQFYANRVDDMIRIPAGRYSFAGNKGSNTVLAAYMTVDNQGNITSEGGAWVASNLVVQGGQMVSGDVRYIVSGTADVANANGQLYIVVSGSNSLYRTVNFTIGQPATGIEEVNMDNVQDGQKMMIDGQLYIKRGENLYNAQGAVVK